MPNAVERVEEFLKAYGMSPSFTDVDACARAFQRDMERGLQGAKDAWMMMLPTYLSLEGEVPEEEPTIVIDAGAPISGSALLLSTPKDRRWRT